MSEKEIREEPIKVKKTSTQKPKSKYPFDSPKDWPVKEGK